MALFFIGLVGLIGSVAFLFFRTRKLAKCVTFEALNLKRELLFELLIVCVIGLFGALTFAGIPFTFTDKSFFIWDGRWDSETCLPVLGSGVTAGEWICIIFGSFLSSFIFFSVYVCFRLYYYQKKLPQKLSKAFYIFLLLGLPLLYLSIWLLSEGFAQHLIYPLAKGILISSSGLSVVRPGGASPTIAWYAICILSGAIYVYFICDHRMYKLYGKHGILESTLYIAFPAGILGARISYVIGEWSTKFADRFARGEWWSLFAVWEGGITILGGAIGGILVGILWFVWRHPECNIFKVMDIVIPTILVAQAVGRWGNFFNCEVHGEMVAESYFSFLPTFIINNSHFSSSASSSWSNPGTIFAPLFFVEGVVNLLGFYLMYFLFSRTLKDFTRDGDMFGGYMIWYGYTRVLMEPLRASDFNMGKDGAWSWIWANIFVIIGALFISINHIVRAIIDHKKSRFITNRKYDIISLPIYTVNGLALFIIGLVMRITSPSPDHSMSAISLVPYNIGFILLTTGISLLLISLIPAIYIYFSKKTKLKESLN